MTPAIESQWPLIVAGRTTRYAELADAVQERLLTVGCVPLGLSHFALVVGDLDSALQRLAACGDPAWRDVRAVWGEAFGCHAAMHHQDGVELEVLQPVRDSFLLDALRQNGEGLHHLCFNVEDIEHSSESLRGQGEHPVDGRIYNGLHGRIHFFSPGAFCPLHLELCQQGTVSARNCVMSYNRLAGQVAWVSGGNSGIGAATVELFAAEGAAVAVVGRRMEQCREVADRILANGGRALPMACDVEDEVQVRGSIDRTASELGGLHILVNNAGMVDVRPLHEYSVEQWERVMGVNVRSMFLAAKHGLPHLRRSPRSYVVNVGSISSFVGQAGTPVYTTSKHTVVGLTRSMALDYAALGMRCNCVCPGITDTPMLREHLDASGDPEGMLRQRLKRVPMGVALTPHDVAKSILFFSCEDSSGITGTSLVIDGGYLTAAEWESPAHTAFMDTAAPE